jgi:hypothetical protein
MSYSLYFSTATPIAAEDHRGSEREGHRSQKRRAKAFQRCPDCRREHDQQGGRVGEPLELLALVPPRSAEAQHQRGEHQDHEQGEQQEQGRPNELQQFLGCLEPQRVRRRQVVMQWAGLEDDRRRVEEESGCEDPDHRAPAA